MVVEKNGCVHAILSVSEKMGRRVKKKKGGGREKKIRPVGEKIARIVRAAGSLFRVAESSPLSIIQRLLRETRCSCWNIRVFKAVRMNGRRVVTG